MREVFESTQINGMTLANRFVRSATWEGMATSEGLVTSKLIKTMAELARGQVGLIISGHAYISAEGQVSPYQMGIHKHGCVAGLREMTAAVHTQGGKIVAQLAHAGVRANRQFTHQTPLAVSVFEGLTDTPCREISMGDIGKLVAAFAAAAGRAKTAGFDGVQIHSAHGYYLNQFLSPFYNRRRDAYGGSVRNRARIHLEMLAAIRAVVGVDYPVLIKINCSDFSKEGLTLADALETGKLLAAAGLDAIEISGGSTSDTKLPPFRVGINSETKEAYFRNEAKAFKAQIEIPLILVGGIRSFSVAQNLVAEGVTDYISMSRPLIREPDLIQRWKAGDRRKAQCKSDNLCFEPGTTGRGIYCVTRELEQNRRSASKAAK